jgi:hypothetical protein
MSEKTSIKRRGTASTLHWSDEPTLLNLSAPVIRFVFRTLHRFSVHFLFLLFVVSTPGMASAQLTTGTINGRVVDDQGAAIPGVTIAATSADTGLTRTDVTDGAGGYRLAALPVGSYTLTAELSGFQRVERTVVVNVGTTIGLDVTLHVGTVSERVDVRATATPFISTRSSSVGEVVDLTRIENLPLNGRQFANLAATVPGVGLGFHSDPSKASQYSPQISGGNGRNINYLIDGGDNNDDTVGGLLQMYPLEAIQEFNLITQRFDAEYGRANGAVLNVVTKSGTNTLHGSWFTLGRDDAMNAQTETERINHQPKQPYSRYQYGGSFGGPIVRDKVHFFGAYERTQQDTKQTDNTHGLFPADEGVFAVPVRDNLFTGKLTIAPAPAHYVAIRYGAERNSGPTGVGPNVAHSAWATSSNMFDSVNVNHNWITGNSSLNELVVQYSRFVNDVPANTAGPTLMFPNGVAGGTNLAAPQSTNQEKWQLRDDYSWTRSGFGLAHEVRTGVSWIHEPTLFTRTAQGTQGIYQMLTNDINGPVFSALKIGGNVESNIPLDFYGAYVQDDWRVADRLTVNLGLRYDYVQGMPIDQSSSPNFRAMQAAGAAGRFAGTVFSDFGKSTRADANNVQPRIGAVYDLRGDGRDVLRGGWGIYTDLGYTNSNALTASFDANGGGGIVFSAASPGGLRKADGTFFRATDPLDSIAALNTVKANTVTAGEVVTPRLQQPFSYQTNVGWGHELTPSTVVNLDYVRVQGRDLNMRLRANTLVDGVRYLGDVGVQPNNQQFRVALSAGRSEYDALIAAVRRRMSQHVDVDASYTLASATGDVGSAYDELELNLIQDITNPLGPVQNGPQARTDARHRVTVSAIVELPWAFRVAPIFSYRSALPIHTIEGADVNGDANLNDKTALAYRYTGLNDDGTAAFAEDGPCETVNCSRRAAFSQLNLRVSRRFALSGPVHIEAIAEVFNVFNARNPYLNISTQRLTRGVPNSGFMQPIAFAGDVGQPEQRVGQIGFRLTF